MPSRLSCSSYEQYLNDLYFQEAQLELERGYKITKKDLLDFIAELIKGDKNDKDYQRKIIDNLVTQIFVSDDDTVVYFNIRGGKNIETLNFEDVKSSISSLKSVQTQLPLARQVQTIRTLCGFGLFFIYITIKKFAIFWHFFKF